MHELVEYAAPALAETDDLSYVRESVSFLRRRGIGAQRQRAATDDALTSVPRLVTADTDGQPDESPRTGTLAREGGYLSRHRVLDEYHDRSRRTDDTHQH